MKKSHTHKSYTILIKEVVKYSNKACPHDYGSTIDTSTVAYMK